MYFFFWVGISSRDLSIAASGFGTLRLICKMQQSVHSAPRGTLSRNLVGCNLILKQSGGGGALVTVACVKNLSLISYKLKTDSFSFCTVQNFLYSKCECVWEIRRLVWIDTSPESVIFQHLSVSVGISISLEEWHHMHIFSRD